VDVGLLGQYVANGLMLGVIYAMVAVGFTLFFGVLDIIQFSHGDVLTVGAFAGLATFLGLQAVFEGTSGIKSDAPGSEARRRQPLLHRGRTGREASRR